MIVLAVSSLRDPPGPRVWIIHTASRSAIETDKRLPNRPIGGRAVTSWRRAAPEKVEIRGFAEAISAQLLHCCNTGKTNECESGLRMWWSLV